MSLLWTLSALLHGVAAVACALSGLRHRTRGLLLLGGWLVVLAAWCVAQVFESSPAWLSAWLASASGILALAAVAFAERQTATRRNAEAKACALEAEARAMLEKGSSDVQTSRSRFRHLVEVTRLGIFEADAEGRYVFVSRRWQELTGLHAKEARGEGWLAAVRDDERQRMREAWRAAATSGAAFELDWPLAQAGEFAWVHCQATPRKSPHDESLTYIGTLTDISERKRLEAERRRLDESEAHTRKLESLGVMAGGIAHDFNNLLVGVLGNAELLRQEHTPDDARAELLERIECAARRAADLAQQMLVFAGKGVAERKALDLSSVVEESLALFTGAERRRMRCNLGRELPIVFADRTQLQQLVTNLVRNALESSEDLERFVSIKTEARRVSSAELDQARLASGLKPGQAVVLEVSDAGCGISAEDQPRIFDPFYSTKFTGRGLGLGVVAGAVRANGGSLILDSAPGRGTTVRVIFDAGSAATVPAEPGIEPASAAPAAGTLLVIDDEPLVRDTLRAILERAGYSVLLAQSGSQALDLLRLNPGGLDAVLLDMTMPDMDGRETLGALRGLEPELPVLLLSGHSEQDIKRAFSADELAGFLLKPFSSADLLSSVARALSPGERSSRS
jgi:PAS domain S-box-containing protein